MSDQTAHTESWLDKLIRGKAQTVADVSAVFQHLRQCTTTWQGPGKASWPFSCRAFKLHSGRRIRPLLVLFTAVNG